MSTPGANKQFPTANQLAMQMAERRGDTALMDRLKNMPIPKSVKEAKDQVKYMADQMTKMRNEPTKMDSTVRKKSSATMWPETIIQTTDVDVVR